MKKRWRAPGAATVGRWTPGRLSAWSEIVFAQLGGLEERERAWVLRTLTAAQRRELVERWYGQQHDGQREPPGDWRIWLIQAGRGFGKTRAGAEWVSEIARGMPEARIALVAATIADGRKVMIEGPSGLIAAARDHVGARRRWRGASRAMFIASPTG